MEVGTARRAVRLRVPQRGVPTHRLDGRLGEASLPVDAWKPREGHRQFALVVGLVDELAGEIVHVRLHVEVSVPAEVEEDRLRHALLPAADGLVDRPAHGVIGLGRRQDALGPSELHARVEAFLLHQRARLDQPEFLEVRHHRRHAVIAQPAGVESWRHERGPERVHLGERRHVPGVAEIVRVRAAREARARRRLDGDDADVRAAAQLGADEREGDAGEVRSAARGADDHVGVVVGQFQLLDGLHADHGLVQQDVVEHRAERVVGVGVVRGDFHGFRDRHAEAAVAVGVVREHVAAVLRLARRARDAAGAVGLHQRPAIRLLVVRHAHHEHLHVDAEERAREGERRPPLARAGLGGDLPDAGLPVVEGLRHRGVRLVAAGRAHALVLVVDAGRRLQRLLEAAGAVERTSAATGDRRRARVAGSRSRGRWRPPARSAPSGTAARGRRGRAAAACPDAAAAGRAPAGRRRGCTRWWAAWFRRAGTSRGRSWTLRQAGAIVYEATASRAAAVPAASSHGLQQVPLPAFTDGLRHPHHAARQPQGGRAATGRRGLDQLPHRAGSQCRGSAAARDGCDARPRRERRVGAAAVRSVAGLVNHVRRLSNPRSGGLGWRAVAGRDPARHRDDPRHERASHAREPAAHDRVLCAGDRDGGALTTGRGLGSADTQEPARYSLASSGLPQAV